MNYFIYSSQHFTPHGRYEFNKLTSLPMCGFIAQLVEHRTIRELYIGLRERDLVQVRLSNFKPATFPEPSFFILVLGRESSSWDEMGMCCDNMKPEN